MATERRIAAASHHITHQKLRAIRLDDRQHLLLKEMDVALLRVLDAMDAEGGRQVGDFKWEIRVDVEYEVEVER